MRSHPFKVAPNFIVPDVVATAEWYRDVLGFDSVRYDGEPPNFALVGRGDVSFMFKSRPGILESFPNGKVHEDVGWDAYLWVPDVDRCYAEIQARGGRVMREIENTYYGCRDFEVQDLNGYLLCFGQEIPAVQGGDRDHPILPNS